MLLASVFSYGADRGQTMVMTGLSYRVIPHERTSTYQTPGASSTACWGSGTYWGLATNARINCSTVTTPPQQRSVTIRQIEVFNELESNGMVYTIRCSANWFGSNCAWLEPGKDYRAEVDGNAVWISAPRTSAMQGKVIRVKYQLLGQSLKPAPSAVVLPQSAVPIPIAPQPIQSYARDDLRTIMGVTRPQSNADEFWKAARSGNKIGLEQLTLLAQRGDVAAQFGLGDIYERGEGATKDLRLSGDQGRADRSR